MKAIIVRPRAGGLRVDEIPEPPPDDGAVLVECVAVGVCGTDGAIVGGHYGWPPSDRTDLVLGHESLGRVLDPGRRCGLREGDLVAGMVRRPDGLPCESCAVGEPDMCRNGDYTERGIKQLDGFMSERWRLEPDYALKVDPALGLLGVLLEPTAVMAKAWEHAVRVGQRTYWEPHRVLVTGAGPLGLLGALIAKQSGAEVHVVDRATGGPKPELVSALGGVYHSCGVADIGYEPDVVLECTGAGEVISATHSVIAPGGVVCLVGLGRGGALPAVPIADVAAAAVLRNNVLIGSVSANRRHWFKASEALARAEHGWLGRLITRREPPESIASALERRAEDIKVVVQFAEV